MDFLKKYFTVVYFKRIQGKSRHWVASIAPLETNFATAAEQKYRFKCRYRITETSPEFVLYCSSAIAVEVTTCKILIQIWLRRIAQPAKEITT